MSQRYPAPRPAGGRLHLPGGHPRPVSGSSLPSVQVVDSMTSCCKGCTRREQGCHVGCEQAAVEDIVKIIAYADKLNKIVKRYRLDFNKTERTFSLKVPTDQPDYFVKYLGYFLQALSLLANIDV